MSTQKSKTETRIYKSIRGGWQGETYEKFGGYDWNIYTMKGYSGKINSVARAGFLNKSHGMIAFQHAGSLLNDVKVDLIQENKRATEKTIREQHYRALAMFDELRHSDKLPKNPTEGHKEAYKLEVGQEVIFFGAEMEQSKLYIHHIEELKNRFDKYQYSLINLKTRKLSFTNRIEPIEKKFGIGYYYQEDKKHSNIDELQNIVIEVKEAERKENERKEEERNIENAITRNAIEEGLKTLKIPKNATSVIVAEYHTNECDLMTDYFASKVIKTIYLAFSPHKKNIFSEMRKACLNVNDEEIRKFSEYNEDFEHRQNYTGGSGYFLQSGSTYSGWRIKKETYNINLESDQTKERLALAISENRFFCNVEPQKTLEENNISLDDLNIEVIDYSEKAIAVIGDTKEVKDILKSNGGRFNRRLTVKGEKVAGWIFPKSKKDIVLNSLKK